MSLKVRIYTQGIKEGGNFAAGGIRESPRYNSRDGFSPIYGAIFVDAIFFVSIAVIASSMTMAIELP